MEHKHVYPVTFAIFSQLEVRHRSCSPSRGGGHTRVHQQEGGITGAILVSAHHRIQDSDAGI